MRHIQPPPPRTDNPQRPIPPEHYRVSNKSPNIGVQNQVARADIFTDTFNMLLELNKLSGTNSECAVSSVVEHYLDTVGVTGSNPVSRTIPPRP